MGPHGLELAEITELVLQQGGPPADGQVLAVHAVVLALLGNSEMKNDASIIRVFASIVNHSLT